MKHSMGESKRIGLFGGTFDPVHRGHLAAASYARKALALDSVWFLPAVISPLKTAHPAGHIITPFEKRAAMIELAISGCRGFLLSRFESERPGPSFTVDTLTELRHRLGEETELFFIVGADAFLQMPAWKDFNQLSRLANLAVISRPSFTEETVGEIVAECFMNHRFLPGSKTWQGGTGEGNIHFLDMDPVGASSTEIREMVSRGRSVNHLVPVAVEEYIRLHGLYHG